MHACNPAKWVFGSQVTNTKVGGLTAPLYLFTSETIQWLRFSHDGEWISASVTGDNDIYLVRTVITRDTASGFL